MSLVEGDVGSGCSNKPMLYASFFSSTSLLRVVASVRHVGGASLRPNPIEVLDALGRGLKEGGAFMLPPSRFFRHSSKLMSNAKALAQRNHNGNDKRKHPMTMSQLPVIHTLVANQLARVDFRLSWRGSPSSSSFFLSVPCSLVVDPKSPRLRSGLVYFQKFNVQPLPNRALGPSSGRGSWQ